jgi:hypothetical protein
LEKKTKDKKRPNTTLPSRKKEKRKKKELWACYNKAKTCGLEKCTSLIIFFEKKNSLTTSYLFKKINILT